MNWKIIGCLLVGGAAAQAQPCGTVRHSCAPITRTYTPHVPAVPVVVTPGGNTIKEIVAPVAVPILVPAFQFQYSPQTFVPGQVAYPAPTGYPVAGYGQSPVVPGAYGQSGYGQPCPPVQGMPPQDRIKELARALLEEMNRQSTQADNGPPVASDGTPPPPAGPPGVNPNAGTPLMTPQQAAPIAMAALAKNCQSCHTGVGAKGDTALYVQPNVLAGDAPWRSVIKEIDAGRMPPRLSQFRLTPYEKAAIKAWLAR